MIAKKLLRDRIPNIQMKIGEIFMTSCRGDGIEAEIGTRRLIEWTLIDWSK